MLYPLSCENQPLQIRDEEMKSVTNEYRLFINKNNIEVSCQCCTAVENHKMKDIRLICNRITCSNENRICGVKYKILRCCNKNKYTVYQIGDHVNNNEESVEKSSKRGIQH